MRDYGPALIALGIGFLVSLGIGYYYLLRRLRQQAAKKIIDYPLLPQAPSKPRRIWAGALFSLLGILGILLALTVGLFSRIAEGKPQDKQTNARFAAVVLLGAAFSLYFGMRQFMRRRH